MTLIDLLKYYKGDSIGQKIRLGNKFDGGYVVPHDAIKNVDVAYSYGVGDDISFELDLIKINPIPVHMYDHTVSGLPKKNEMIKFHKEGLSSKKEEYLNTFTNHRESNGDADKRVLLKIDVEGAEYDYLSNLKYDEWNNVQVVIFEIHDIEKNVLLLEKILKEMYKKYFLIHVHGNNFGKVFLSEKYVIPDMLEITLVSKEIIKNPEIDDTKLPIPGLDYPCSPDLKDFSLDFTDTNLDYSKLDEWLCIFVERSNYFFSELFKNEKAFKEKDDYIDSLRKTLAKKDEYIESLNNAIVEKDEYIESLNNAIVEKDKYIESLKEKSNI